MRRDTNSKGAAQHLALCTVRRGSWGGSAVRGWDIQPREKPARQLLWADGGPGLLLLSPRLQSARDSSAGQRKKTRSQVDLLSWKPLFLKCPGTFALRNEFAGSWRWPHPPLLAPPGGQTAELLQLAAKLSLNFTWSTPSPPSELAQFYNSLITHRWILCKVCMGGGRSEQKLICLMSFALTVILQL